MIDASCTQWEDDCGTKGSCWVYDSAGMSMRLFVLALVLKVLSIFFNVLALCVYKAPKNDEELAAGEMNNLTDNANNNSSTNNIIIKKVLNLQLEVNKKLDIFFQAEDGIRDRDG